MKINISSKMIFGFEPPNLSFLGNEADFRMLAEVVLDLTDPSRSEKVEINSLSFVVFEGENRKLVFSSLTGGRDLAVDSETGDLIFNLDQRYWERLFKFFVMMSWDKKTYYLNAYEGCLDDFSLNQDLNFICSSEF